MRTSTRDGCRRRQIFGPDDEIRDQVPSADGPQLLDGEAAAVEWAAAPSPVAAQRHRAPVVERRRREEGLVPAKTSPVSSAHLTRAARRCRGWARDGRQLPQADPKQTPAHVVGIVTRMPCGIGSTALILASSSPPAPSRRRRRRGGSRVGEDHRPVGICGPAAPVFLQRHDQRRRSRRRCARFRGRSVVSNRRRRLKRETAGRELFGHDRSRLRRADAVRSCRPTSPPSRKSSWRRQQRRRASDSPRAVADSVSVPAPKSVPRRASDPQSTCFAVGTKKPSSTNDNVPALNCRRLRRRRRVPGSRGGHVGRRKAGDAAKGPRHSRGPRARRRRARAATAACLLEHVATVARRYSPRG